MQNPAIQASASASRATRAATLILMAACAYVVVAPNVGVYYSELESFDVWRGLQTALLVGVAAAFALFRPVGELVGAAVAALPRAVRRALAAVAVLGIVSSLAAARPAYGVREVAQLSLLVLLALAVAGAARELGARFHRIAAHAIAVGALFYLAVYFAALFGDPFGRSAWSTNPLFGFPTPRFFGHVESWLLPLLALPLARREPGRTLTYVGVWAAAAGWWMLLFVSGSRAPLLALSFGVAAAVGVLGRRALPWLRAHAIALALSAAAYQLIPGVAGSSTLTAAVERGTSSNGRAEMWARAFGLLRDSPLLGAGPEHYAFYRPAEGHNPAHPHNTALQWASEWGLPAGLLMCGVLAWGLWSWSRARRAEAAAPDADLVAAGLTAALFAAAAHSFLDGMAVMPLPQTVGAVVIGWALGVHQGARAAESMGWSWPARVAALAAAAALLVTATLPVRELSPGEARSPRFWIHGAIP